MYLLILGKRYKDTNDQDVEFNRLLKKSNELICYPVNGDVFTIGTPRWNNLSVEGGEFETKVTKEELLLKEIANLKLENKKKDLIAKNLMQQVAEIRLNLKKEGN